MFTTFIMLAEIYTVSKLQMAPLKSGGLLELDKAWIGPSGMETVCGSVRDHEFFAVRANPDANGVHHFVSQRSHEVPDQPKARKENFRQLALVKPSFGNRGHEWGWGNPDNQKITVNQPCDEATIRKIRIWDFEGEAVEIPHLTEWIRDVSGYDIRIMKTVGPWDRPVRQNYIKNSNKIRAQDGYPIHAILEADVNAVSAHAGADIPWDRYRAQLMLAGGEPWSLHDVYEGELNGIPIVQAKPCGRCPITGFDQEKGVPSPLKPLAQVDSMRPRWFNTRGEEEIIFGENWVPFGGAIVQLGDEFKPTSYRVPPNPVLRFTA